MERKQYCKKNSIKTFLKKRHCKEISWRKEGKERLVVSWGPSTVLRSAINDKGGWETRAPVPGARPWSQETWICTHTLQLCSSPLPSFQPPPPQPESRGFDGCTGGICCSSCSSGASLAGGLPSWAQPTAHPEGHLLLNFTIAQAYGLQSPSLTWWKPRRPPEVRKSFRAQEWQGKKKKSHVSRKWISSTVQSGFREVVQKPLLSELNTNEASEPW